MDAESLTVKVPAGPGLEKEVEVRVDVSMRVSTINFIQSLCVLIKFVQSIQGGMLLGRMPQCRLLKQLL